MGGQKAETGYFRTESGVVLEMDLPLPDGIAHRVAKGEIVRVASLAGGVWQEPNAQLPEPTGDQAQDVLVGVRAELAAAQERVEELESEKVDLQAQLSAAQDEIVRLNSPPPEEEKPPAPEAKPKPARGKTSSPPRPTAEQ